MIVKSSPYSFLTNLFCVSFSISCWNLECTNRDSPLLQGRWDILVEWILILRFWLQRLNLFLELATPLDPFHGQIKIPKGEIRNPKIKFDSESVLACPRLDIHISDITSHPDFFLFFVFRYISGRWPVYDLSSKPKKHYFIQRHPETLDVMTSKELIELRIHSLGASCLDSMFSVHDSTLGFIPNWILYLSFTVRMTANILVYFSHWRI